MDYGKNMNKFYRKPKPETMKQNREFYNKHYEKEIKWLKENLDKINKYNDFLSDMPSECLVHMISIYFTNKDVFFELLNIKI